MLVPSIFTVSIGAPRHWSPLALMVRPVIGLDGVIGADSDPFPDRTTIRPPLADQSVAILPPVDIASASSVKSPVAENAGSAGPHMIVAPDRINAPTKRESRFMMTSAIDDP